MKSRLTLALAGVLLTGAITAGYQGLKLSMNTPAPSPADNPADNNMPEPLAGAVMVGERLVQEVEQEQRSPVVVLANDIQPQVPIQASDVRVEQLLIAPPGSFSDPAQVIGQLAWHTLPAGVVLNRHSFEVGGPLARMIGPDERALAIAVDDIVAGGGFIRPGDYVDVLLHLREDRHNPQPTAQVVIPALRVLSYGSALGLNSQGEPVSYDTDDANKNQRRSGAAGHAVLAVPAPLLTYFMLAAEVGSLRLAVRSAEESLLLDYYAEAQARQHTAQAERREANARAAVTGSGLQPVAFDPARASSALTAPPTVTQPTVTPPTVVPRQGPAYPVTELKRQLVAFEQLALHHTKPAPAAVSDSGQTVRQAVRPARAPASVTVYRGTAVSQQTP